MYFDEIKDGKAGKHEQENIHGKGTDSDQVQSKR